MSDPDQLNKEISSLGEFGLIRHLTKNISIKNKSTVLGVGDDAAVIDYGDNITVITTDLLTEGIHFNLVYTPLKHLGYKAAVVNFSDIFAMNAHPRQLLVSLAVSKKFTLHMVEELYEGINLACDLYGVDLAGGDTTSSITGLTINCTAVGEAKAADIVYRNGAVVNDLICVSGNLGGAYMGLQVLERERLLFEKERDLQPSLSGYDYVLESQLKPEARADIIRLMSELGIRPTSMIDISDGLSSELMHLCSNSGKGCRVYTDKIPIHAETRKVAEEFMIDPLIAAFNGGEDYELLFTIPVTLFDLIGTRHDITPIGHMVDAAEGTKLVTPNGQEIQLEAQGWNALKQSNPLHQEGL